MVTSKHLQWFCSVYRLPASPDPALQRQNLSFEGLKRFLPSSPREELCRCSSLRLRLPCTGKPHSHFSEARTSEKVFCCFYHFDLFRVQAKTERKPRTQTGHGRFVPGWKIQSSGEFPDFLLCHLKFYERMPDSIFSKPSHLACNPEDPRSSTCPLLLQNHALLPSFLQPCLSVSCTGNTCLEDFL